MISSSHHLFLGYNFNKMVPIFQPPRPNSSSSSSYAIKNFTNKHLLLLILLPSSVLLLTLYFQWRGGSVDELMRLSVDRPVVCTSPAPAKVNSSSSKHPDELVTKTSAIFSQFSRKFNYSDYVLRPKICIISTTSAGLEDILPWIYFHKVVGISNFFLFVEGKAATPSVSKVLESIPGIKIIPRTTELEEQEARSRIWNETWLASSIHKPCNGALFVKQTLNMEMAIVMARDAGMEWILHLDTDELLHPAGTREYSMAELLSKVPNDVDTVVFMNYESAVERDNIKEPFSEVSLFKRNLADFPTNHSNFKLVREATQGNPSYFLTYANGKSAARIQDHLQSKGAHRWTNYIKDANEMKMNEAVVLHYTYSRFSALTSRRDRCNCKPTYEDAKRCFYLRFDRSAFIVASTAPREELLRWYQEHVVWSDEKMKLRLLKYGILTRIYTPMVIIQQLRKSKVFAPLMALAQEASSSSPYLPNMGNNNSQASPSLYSPSIMA